uniref:Uncharacterized protein n=1 Tax=Ciona intestinalis TaxID=7719 RepID=H2Y2T4_CIOIN
MSFKFSKAPYYSELKLCNASVTYSYLYRLYICSSLLPLWVYVSIGKTLNDKCSKPVVTDGLSKLSVKHKIYIFNYPQSKMHCNS